MRNQQYFLNFITMKLLGCCSQLIPLSELLLGTGGTGEGPSRRSYKTERSYWRHGKKRNALQICLFVN
jgi:hypothetical protein